MKLPYAIGAMGVVAILAAAASASTARALEQIEGAYEASLIEVVLPASADGYVVVPPCSNCPPVSLAASASTAYIIGRTPVPHGDFVRAAAELSAAGRGRSAAVYVFYDLETKRVTRLVIDDLEA